MLYFSIVCILLIFVFVCVSYCGVLFIYSYIVVVYCICCFVCLFVLVIVVYYLLFIHT